MKIKKAYRLKVFIALLVIMVMAVASVYLLMISLYPLKYSEEVYSASEKYDIDPALMFSLIHAESSFNPEAVSYVGAIGLTQFTEDTFDWVKWKKGDESDTEYDDMFSPDIAIEYGAFLLSFYLNEYTATENALSAYNAGMGTLENWLSDEKYSEEINGVRVVNNIPYEETENYINKINNSVKIYKILYDM